MKYYAPTLMYAVTHPDWEFRPSQALFTSRPMAELAARSWKRQLAVGEWSIVRFAKTKLARVLEDGLDAVEHL